MLSLITVELVSSSLHQLPGRRGPYMWKKGSLLKISNRDNDRSGYKAGMAEFQYKGSCRFCGNLEVWLLKLPGWFSS